MTVRRGFEIIFLSALLPLAAGCPGDDTPDAGATAVVELGTGTVEWEPLTADQELPLIAGAQGGHHFIVHARAQNIIPGDPAQPGQLGNPSSTFRAYDEDGEQLDLDFPPYRLGYDEPGDGWLYLPSGRILQVKEELVESLYGQRVRITAWVQDASGAYGTDERWITAVRDESGADAGIPADAGVPDGGS